MFGFVKTLDSGRGSMTRVIEHDAFHLINWTLHLLPQTQIKWSFGTHQPNQPNSPSPPLKENKPAAATFERCVHLGIQTSARLVT